MVAMGRTVTSRDSADAGPTLNEQSVKLKSSLRLERSSGKTRSSAGPLLEFSHPNMKTFFLRECPCMSQKRKSLPRDMVSMAVGLAVPSPVTSAPPPSMPMNCSRCAHPDVSELTDIMEVCHNRCLSQKMVGDRVVLGLDHCLLRSRPARLHL